MINQLNKPEANLAVIELCYGPKIEKPIRKGLLGTFKEMLNSNKFDEAHWRNVLSYCKDGNFQALLDEYVHILVDSNGINDAENKHEAYSCANA